MAVYPGDVKLISLTLGVLKEKLPNVFEEPFIDSSLSDPIYKPVWALPSIQFIFSR
ncbi:MAG: hypothetical protein [Bacteriophage sp.]|nr:MAG: hypothetical protein [Bacteriophage sp.]